MNKRWKWSLPGLVVSVLAVAFLITIRKPPLPPALPTPNGYDDLIKAAGQVVSEGRAYRDVSDAELRDLVRQNREVLASVRATYQRECRAPIVYDPAYLATQSQVFSGFKRLARAFWAEAVLAEREGRTNEAARTYMDGIRFGQEIGHGGRLIDRLVGMSCQALLLPSLTNLVQNLDAQSCRELARLLESMDHRSEPWEATMRRERIWIRVVAGLRGQLAAFLHDIKSRWRSGIWPPRQFRNNLKRIQSQERRLILDLLDGGPLPARALLPRSAAPGLGWPTWHVGRSTRGSSSDSSNRAKSCSLSPAPKRRHASS